MWSLAAALPNPYNPVVRCHAGKTAGFVLAERHLTLPAGSVNSVECGPNGKRTFNPGVVGSALLRRVKIPHGPPVLQTSGEHPSPLNLVKEDAHGGKQSSDSPSIGLPSAA